MDDPRERMRQRAAKGRVRTASKVSLTLVQMVGRPDVGEVQFRGIGFPVGKAVEVSRDVALALLADKAYQFRVSGGEE